MKPVRIRSVIWSMKLVEAIGEKLDFILFSFYLREIRKDYYEREHSVSKNDLTVIIRTELKLSILFHF